MLIYLYDHSTTGWQFHLFKSCWLQNKGFALVGPVLAWPGQNGTYVWKSTGGFAQAELSPCTMVQLRSLNNFKGFLRVCLLVTQPCLVLQSLLQAVPNITSFPSVLVLLPHLLFWCSLPMGVLCFIISHGCQGQELFVVIPKGIKVKLVVVVEPFSLCLAQSWEILPSEILCWSSRAWG